MVVDVPDVWTVEDPVVVEGAVAVLAEEVGRVSVREVDEVVDEAALAGSVKRRPEQRN